MAHHVMTRRRTAMVAAVLGLLVLSTSTTFSQDDGFGILTATLGEGVLQNVPAGGLVLINVTYWFQAGIHTFDFDTETTHLFLQCQGAGGGGGGASSSAGESAFAGGGAAGGYTQTHLSRTSDRIRLSVGTPGTGGTSAPTDGAAGTITRVEEFDGGMVGAILCDARGGPGGEGMASGTGFAIAEGGPQASAALGTGDLLTAGASGLPGFRLNSTIGFSGAGGSSVFNGGGEGNADASTGRPGRHGSGGSGGSSIGGGGFSGGIGGVGTVVLYEYKGGLAVGPQGPQGDVGPQGPPGVTNFTFFATGTTPYSPSLDSARFMVECVGGGGGGGGSQQGLTLRGAGGGGGAGGYSRLVVDAPFSSNYTVTVGLGGAGGAAGDNDGSPGGTSVFGNASLGDILSCGGGAGGEGGQGTAVSGAFLGGLGGAASGGDVDANGMTGEYGIVIGDSVQVSGRGGGSYFGDGGPSRRAVNPGVNATAPGAGGSGAASSTGSSNQPGGNGAPGVIIIWEFGVGEPGDNGAPGMDGAAGAAGGNFTVLDLPGMTEAQAGALLVFLVFLVLAFFQRWLFVAISSVIGILDIVLVGGIFGFIFTFLLLVLALVLETLRDMRDARDAEKGDSDATS